MISTAVIGLVAGFAIFGAGVVPGMDPEGRGGGASAGMLIVGAVLMVVSLGYLLILGAHALMGMLFAAL